MKESLLNEDDTRQSWLENLLFPARNLNKEKLAASVEHKTILITGASYGIGAELTRLLSEYNVTLLLVARTKEKLDHLQASLLNCSCIIKTYVTDLREEEQIKNLLNELRLENVQIDIFINNAGKSIYRKIEDSIERYHDTKRSAGTNYLGPVQLLLGLLNGFLNNKGHIINVSAINVLLLPAIGWSAYQSSKIAFDQWLRCAEVELKIRGLVVSHIYLPLVRTDMSMVNKNKKTQPAMSKAKAVQLLANFIVHRKRKYTPWWVGAVITISSIFPNAFYKFQLLKAKRKMK